MLIELITLLSYRNGYEVDYCYEQNEDNSMIFSREIQPLISRVFDGQNVGIIAFGATGSGKTYTIQVRLFIDFISFNSLTLVAINNVGFMGVASTLYSRCPLLARGKRREN